MTQATTRLGLIGYGQIGQAVHAAIEADQANGMDVVFIHDMDSSNLDELPADMALRDLRAFAERDAEGPDIYLGAHREAVTTVALFGRLVHDRPRAAHVRGIVVVIK